MPHQTHGPEFSYVSTSTPHGPYSQRVNARVTHPPYLLEGKPLVRKEGEMRESLGSVGDGPWAAALTEG